MSDNLGDFEQLVMLAVMGGRSKRFYRLSPDGRRTLGKAVRTVRRMVQGLELKLERS